MLASHTENWTELYQFVYSIYHTSYNLASAIPIPLHVDCEWWSWVLTLHSILDMGHTEQSVYNRIIILPHSDQTDNFNNVNHVNHINQSC